jgi:hypothetical protein
MKALKTFYTSLFVLLILGFLSNTALAIPSSQALYWEYDLGGGLWKYDYILHNTSDPIADAGYDIYDLTLYFPGITLTNILSPSNWDLITDSSSFIDWYSKLPGEPPLGADIAPGTSLTGFSFLSNMQLASLSFDVYLTDPYGDPVLYSGNTAPVPEPPTLLLVASGLAGIGFFVRMKYKEWKGVRSKYLT